MHRVHAVFPRTVALALLTSLFASGCPRGASSPAPIEVGDIARRAGVTPMAWLPPGAEVLVHARPRTIYRAPVTQEILERLQHTELFEGEQEAQISQILDFFSRLDVMVVGRYPSPSGDGEAVIVTRGQIDSTLLAEFWSDASPWACGEREGRRASGSAYVILDDGWVAFGRPSRLALACGRYDGGTTTLEQSEVLTDAVASAEWGRHAISFALEHIEVRGEPVPFVGHLDVDAGLSGVVSATFQAEAQAESAYDELERGRARAMTELEALQGSFSRLHVERRGRVVSGTIDLGSEELLQFVDMVIFGVAAFSSSTPSVSQPPQPASTPP